jgi:hypothetical protein
MMETLGSFKFWFHMSYDVLCYLWLNVGSVSVGLVGCKVMTG